MKQEFKYVHYVSYMADNNITGVLQVLSNWKKIDTKTKIQDCLRILSENKIIKNPQLTNILTVKNK